MNTTQDRTTRVTLPACVTFVRANHGLGLLLLVYTTVALMLMFTTIVSTLGTNDLRIAGQHAQMTQQLWAAEAALDQAIVDSQKVLPPALAAGTCTPWTMVMVGPGRYRFCSTTGSSLASPGGKSGGSALVSGVGGSLSGGGATFSVSMDGTSAGGSSSQGNGSLSDLGGTTETTSTSGAASDPGTCPTAGETCTDSGSGDVYDVYAQSIGGAPGNTQVGAVVRTSPPLVMNAILTLLRIDLNGVMVQGSVESLFSSSKEETAVELSGGTIVDDGVSVQGANPDLVKVDPDSSITGEIGSAASPFPKMTPTPPPGAIQLTDLNREQLETGTEYFIGADQIASGGPIQIIVDWGAPDALANIHVICNTTTLLPVTVSGTVTQGTGFPLGTPQDAPLAAFLFHCGPPIVLSGDLGSSYVVAPESDVLLNGPLTVGPIIANSVGTIGDGPVTVVLPPTNSPLKLTSGVESVSTPEVWTTSSAAADSNVGSVVSKLPVGKKGKK